MARICPNCGSRNVSPEGSAQSIHGNPTNWSCSECDYSGPMPEE